MPEPVIVMLDVVTCPECGGHFAECSVEGDDLPNIIQHCVDEHPSSIIAQVVALGREEEMSK